MRLDRGPQGAARGAGPEIVGGLTPEARERGWNGAIMRSFGGRGDREPTGCAIGILALGGYEFEIERMGAAAGRTDQGKASRVAVDASHADDSLERHGRRYRGR
jgi:hypothetical protein